MTLLRSLALAPLAISLMACASSLPKGAATSETTSAAVPLKQGEEAPAKEEKTAAEKWAEAKMAKESSGPKKDKEALDPLAVDGALEASSVPKMEMTAAKELRPKTRADLDAGLAAAQQAKNVDEAAEKLTARLGKPTWIEDGKKRVWVASSGKQCHRLVLEADGTLETETAPVTEWRMLSALAQQNPCTGEIRRGVPGTQH